MKIGIENLGIFDKIILGLTLIVLAFAVLLFFAGDFRQAFWQFGVVFWTFSYLSAENERVDYKREVMAYELIIVQIARDYGERLVLDSAKRLKDKIKKDNGSIR